LVHGSARTDVVVSAEAMTTAPSNALTRSACRRCMAIAHVAGGAVGDMLPTRHSFL
jgi:hypothetical protein